MQVLSSHFVDGIAAIENSERETVRVLQILDNFGKFKLKIKNKGDQSRAGGQKARPNCSNMKICETKLEHISDSASG